MPKDFELEFRDGKRVVAPHVYEMLHGLDTYRMLYEEALNFANGKMLADHVNRHADKMIQRHFKENT